VVEYRIIQEDYANTGDLVADLLLVDPPYNLNKTYDGVKEDRSYSDWVSDLHDRTSAPWKIFFAPPIDDEWLSKIPKPDRIIYWCKTFVQLRKLKWWQYAVTPILVYRSPDAEWYGPLRGERRPGAGLSHFDWIIAPSAMTDVKATRKYYEGGHPGVTGTKVAREIIRNTTKIGDTVLDPMCGLGSIPVAALKEGRNGIGIEISPLIRESF
jgi:DNA modification methylase